MYVYVYEVHGKGVKQSKERATGLCVHGRLGHLFAQRLMTERTWRASSQASEIRLYQPFGGCFEWLESEVSLLHAKRLDHDIACSFIAELGR